MIRADVPDELLEQLERSIQQFVISTDSLWGELVRDLLDDPRKLYDSRRGAVLLYTWNHTGIGICRQNAHFTAGLLSLQKSGLQVSDGGERVCSGASWAPVQATFVLPRCGGGCESLAEVIGEAVPLAGHLCGLLRVFFDQVVHLGPVGAEVVQLPFSVAAGSRNEFPVSDADCAVSSVAPPQAVVRYGTVAFEDGHKASARPGRHFRAFDLVGPRAPGDFEYGRGDVHEV